MASDRSYILVFSLSVTSQYGNRCHGNDDGCRMGKAVPPETIGNDLPAVPGHDRISDRNETQYL